MEQSPKLTHQSARVRISFQLPICVYHFTFLKILQVPDEDNGHLRDKKTSYSFAKIDCDKYKAMGQFNQMIIWYNGRKRFKRLLDFILNKKISLLSFYLHTVTWSTQAITEIIYVHKFQLLGSRRFYC